MILNFVCKKWTKVLIELKIIDIYIYMVYNIQYITLKKGKSKFKLKKKDKLNEKLSDSKKRLFFLTL